MHVFHHSPEAYGCGAIRLFFSTLANKEGSAAVSVCLLNVFTKTQSIKIESILVHRYRNDLELFSTAVKLERDTMATVSKVHFYNFNTLKSGLKFGNHDN